MFHILPLLLALAAGQNCPVDVCDQCCDNRSTYNCSLPGLDYFTPGKYEGLIVNYLSYLTSSSSPNFLPRAQEFEECTGGKISFSESATTADPIIDLGSKDQRGLGIYHAYLMSYSQFPEASALNLAERLDTRVELSNTRFQWESMFPKVQKMGQWTNNGTRELHFLMYDGEFLVPLIRLDLLERDQLPLPNTWEEVLALAERYNNTDINDDGEPDFGICYFPREGADVYDEWWPELIYGIWASYVQVKDTSQGFLFDPRTLEPNMDGIAFSEAVRHMKKLWQLGAEGCISDHFSTGRCAIGFSPPGCWKGIFKNGISRRDPSNGSILWQPMMQDGSYAEPYRFKSFGTTHVEQDGILKACTRDLCPRAEPIPEKGHHGENDRASVLPTSPLAGQLINRAPFFWSGGLGIMIRKTAPEKLKDMMWDFMVYTNSATTSAKDVASYLSWLDAWRSTQLPEDGHHFRAAGWSEVAYREHRNITTWALGDSSNGALNLRLPGARSYTTIILANEMKRHFEDVISFSEAIRRVKAGWRQETTLRGLLDQLKIYRGGLGLDELEDVELCQLHREEMDRKYPELCARFAMDPNDTYLIALIVVVSLLVVAAFMSGIAYVVSTANAKRRLLKEKEDNLEDTVSKGLATVRVLGYPMALINAKDFVKLTSDELESCHEGLRDMGLLRVLDTTEEISYFHTMGNLIVFFSYHWPSWEHLGPDYVQRQAMNHSLHMFAEKNRIPLSSVWVWLDIISIPQKHRGIQVLAINSLYVYAYSVDALIIIAPETFQHQTGEKLGIESYKNRVWTRVEQVAHLSAHGIDSLYLYTPDGLEVVDKKWLMDVVHVFDGQTTCCARRHEDFGCCDRESLVLPLVGLYYRVAAAERRGVDRNEGTSTLYALLENDRDRIFPRTFDFVTVVDGKEVRTRKILFGDLLERVDKHLEQFDVETLSERIHHQPSMSTPVASVRLAAMSPSSGFMGGVASVSLSALDMNEALPDEAGEGSNSMDTMMCAPSDVAEMIEVKM